MNEVAEITTEIAVTHDENSPLYMNGLTIANELTRYHPEYNKIKNVLGEAPAKKAMLTAALMALQVGANPNPAASELWIWIDYKNEICIYLGIAYWRKTIERMGGFGWVYNEDKERSGDRRMSPRPRQVETGIIYECTGYLINNYQKLIRAGIPWTVAQWQVSRDGFGAIEQKEMQGRKLPPHGRSWEWLAEKRAECDLIKKLIGSFDIVDGNMKPEPNPLVEIISTLPRVTADDGY